MLNATDALDAVDKLRLFLSLPPTYVPRPPRMTANLLVSTVDGGVGGATPLTLFDSVCVVACRIRRGFDPQGERRRLYDGTKLKQVRMCVLVVVMQCKWLV